MLVQEVVEATGATLLRGDPGTLIQGVSTDTRNLRPRELFLALSGPNFDGNRFAGEAGRRGAGALLMRSGPGDEVPQLEGQVPIVLHESPREALARLATWHRGRLDIPVVGITGSSGKTTTKEILAQLLGTCRRTVSSPKSFNNDIGVPHTVLMADADTEVLVVELGTNQPGEIARLCSIAQPTCGIITSIGAAHLRGLGSIDGVAAEKSDLYASLPIDGFAVVNLDCPYAERLTSVYSGRQITYSVDGRGEFNALDPWFHAGGTTFRLMGREITSPLLGIHNIHNVLAAIATCHGLGIEIDEVLPAVSCLESSHRRMERIELPGITVLDDTYNANPDSARAGVRVLCGLHGHERRVLVLGDMLELGEGAPEMHHAIGREAARMGIDCLFCVGELTTASAAGALEYGMPAERVRHLGDTKAAAELIPGLLEQGDVVLVKGSNAMGLDLIVQRIREFCAPGEG